MVESLSYHTITYYLLYIHNQVAKPAEAQKSLKKLLAVRVGLVEKSITSPGVVSILALIQYYTALWVG